MTDEHLHAPQQRVRAIVGSEVRVEYAEEYASGSMLVRRETAYTRRVWPAAEWIRDKQEVGCRIFTRRIIVVEDWREVPR